MGVPAGAGTTAGSAGRPQPRARTGRPPPAGGQRHHPCRGLPGHVRRDGGPRPPGREWHAYAAELKLPLHVPARARTARSLVRLAAGRAVKIVMDDRAGYGRPYGT